MSIELETISFRNFMSFGNNSTEINLNKKGTTHIRGKNIDVGGSSGSGKTSIINAICYALYDKTPNNIGKERLINRTNTNKNTLMEVILTFKKDKDRYKIKRTRGEVSSISVIKNDKDITPDSVMNTNRFIESIIEISYELFNRVILFSGNARPFLDLPVHEQRVLIEELLKITMLSQKAIILKEDIRVSEKDIEITKIQIKQYEAQNTLHQKHVSDSEARVLRWEEQHAKDLDSNICQLTSVSNINWEDEKTNHEIAATLKTEISNLSLIINPLVTKKSNLTNEISKLTKEKKHLADDNCPYCLQKYPDAKTKLVEIEKNIGVKQTELDDVVEKLTAYECDMKECKLGLSEIQKVLAFPNLNESYNAKASVEKLTAEISRLQGEVNPHIEAFEVLIAEKEIKINYEGLDNLITDLEHKKFLLKLLTDKHSFIRKKIINKTIPFLNKRISHYVSELDLPHRVSFLPDMLCEISEFGRNLDHGNLSAGEQKRLNLAISLAFRDTLTHLHCSFTNMFNDEIDGGSLSGVNLDKLIRLIKHLAWDNKLAIFIISHRPEFEGRCDNEIFVQKENGFSKTVTEEVFNHISSED